MQNNESHFYFSFQSQFYTTYEVNSTSITEDDRPYIRYTVSYNINNPSYCSHNHIKSLTVKESHYRCLHRVIVHSFSLIMYYGSLWIKWKLLV